MWWNSTKGKKLGFMVKFSICLTWIPYLLGLFTIKVSDLKNISDDDMFLAIMSLGYIVMIMLMIIKKLLKVIWIWLNDDMGKMDPWR